MALVTLQRSPSPSNDPDEESAEGGDEVDGRASLRHKRTKSTLDKLRKIFSTVRFISKLRPCLSESYFTVKGAALILPHSASDSNRRTSRKKHGGEIQRHLQSMLYLLRPEDKIKVAIRLEGSARDNNTQSYMALVSTTGRQDTEEFVILGLDCTTTLHHHHHHHHNQQHLLHATDSTSATSPTSPSSPSAVAVTGGAFEGRGPASASIGLVLPIWMGMKVQLSGDGGFNIYMDDKSYLFKPVSVQAMWSAKQSLDRAVHQAEQMKYLAEGLTHTWIDYYRCKVDTTNQTQLARWHVMEDVEIFAPASLSYTNENESEKIKLIISGKLKEVMMSVDLDEATSRSLRVEVEQALNMKLDEYRAYFDEELIRILGQMDSPSQILDYLYLGSEWNASNLEELQQLGIKYILNVTREIDNFFTGMFHYCNVRLYDVEQSELMKHWLKTYKFITRARKNESKVLVHCKMGISRSASTVMAYLMKENCWQLEQAFEYVKEKRSCVRPNKGFMEQLRTYEGILNASNKRIVFQSKSESDMLDSGDGEDDDRTQQGTFLGDSLFRVMQGSEPLSTEAEILLRKGYSPDYTGMEPDMETDSRSADSMEESLPDMPSPQSEQAPTFTLPQQEQHARPANSAENSSGSRPAHPLLGGETSSRIKPDSSWIKLEVIGESTTDPSHPEAMEVEDEDGQGADSGSNSDRRNKSLDAESPPVTFQMGGDTEGEATAVPKIIIEGASGESSSDAAFLEQQKAECDMGVHQYYSREQIPWLPGTVRNRREEFCGSGQGGASAVDKPAVSKSAKEESELEQSLLEAVSLVKEAPALVSQCESCLELSVIDQEGMDVDERARSVYEREEIPLVPGTVQRTRQEIEQRQKLFGDDCDQSIYGLKGIRRTSSLREERERDSSRTRDSMRRKTCTPIVSPPPEQAMEVEGAEDEVVESERVAAFRLDFEAEACCTENVEMVEGALHERGQGEGKKDVTVYTFGEECVPVKVGIVRRHKEEIESKHSLTHEHSLSMESNGNFSLEDDPQTTTSSTSHQHFAPANTTVRDIPTATDLLEGGTAHNIPEAKQQEWPPPALQSPVSTGGVSDGTCVWKQAACVPRVRSQSEAETSVSGSGVSCGKVGGGAAGTAHQQVVKKTSTGSEPDAGVQAAGDLSDSSLRSERGPLSCHSAEEDLAVDAAHPKAAERWVPFRPYSHSFPSAKRQVAKSNFDPETLAMIREIGSAFVTSPSRTETEESNSGWDRTSLVKHLVRNIEKETKTSKPERKIVIIDKNGRPEKKQSKTESGSSLYKPSPEFTSSMAKHLKDMTPEQLPSSQGQVCVSSTGLPADDSRHSPRSSTQACTGGTSCETSPRGGPPLSERSRSEETPSVVKHLRGRFETHNPHCEGLEGEHHTLLPAASDISPFTLAALPLSAPCHHGDSCHSQTRVPTSAASCTKGHEAFTKCRSLDEQCPSSSPESLTAGSSHVPTVGSEGFTAQPSHSPGDTHSAEVAPCPVSQAAQHEHSFYTSRVQAPWDRDVGVRGGGTEEDRASEGVKVRRLHGKSHPLSRLQKQNQGEVSMQFHSPFHSSM